MTIGFINNPLAGSVITFGAVAGAVLTVFWIVGMINSINFIDGLDGLSSGIAMIAALTLGGISLTVTQNQPVVAVLCFTLAGALAGFLPWNFHPARIFVGTTGVFVIGYTLAVLSLLGTAKVAVALLVLGVPIIDTFWIIVRRLAQRQLSVRAGPWPLPPPAARPGARPPRGRAPDLRDLRAARDPELPVVGHRAGVRVPGDRGGRWPRPLPADREGARYWLQRAHRQRLRGGQRAAAGPDEPPISGTRTATPDVAAGVVASLPAAILSRLCRVTSA